MKVIIRIQVILLALTLLLISDAMAQAQNRLDDPFVIQLNAIGGFAAGVHLGKSLYIGVVQSNAATLESSDSSGGYSDSGSSQTSGSKIYGMDGGSSVTHHFSAHRAAEIRFIPWVPGFFISAGIMERDAEYEIWSFDQRIRTLGENSYNTGYTVELNFAKFNSGVVGLGYYGSTEAGLAFTLSVMATSATQTADVTLTDFTVEPTAADQEALRSYIATKSRERGNGIVLLGVGLAF